MSKVEGATTLFDYKLRGHCIENSGINEILIEYLPVNSSGTVKQDSLSRKTSTWRSLTDKIPLVCSKTGQLIFTFVPRKTNDSERSRELFSQLCTDEAKKYGVAGKFKALISLTPRYPRHPDDTGKPFDAVDYIKIRGAVKNVAGETVAPSASEFWSINHKAYIRTHNNDVFHSISTATGSTAQGKYPEPYCATSDTIHQNSCNCKNLSKSNDSYRFAGSYGSEYQKWAFYMVTSNSGNTICTFDHWKHSPPPIYCVEE